MPWIKLPKSGKPMFLHGKVPKGLAEIPDPSRPAEPEPDPETGPESGPEAEKPKRGRAKAQEHKA